MRWSILREIHQQSLAQRSSDGGRIATNSSRGHHVYSLRGLQDAIGSPHKEEEHKLDKNSLDSELTGASLSLEMKSGSSGFIQSERSSGPCQPKESHVSSNLFLRL